MAAGILALAAWPTSSCLSQSETPEIEETVLASVEAPLSREALNETRLNLESQNIKFNYGNFQFHPQSGALIGVELHMEVEGEVFREYFEFPTDNCVLRIVKESGYRMEGC